MGVNVNRDNLFAWVVLTDENQILYVTNNADEAYLIKEEWEATHASEAICVDLSAVKGLQGWRPDFAPCADIDWSKHE